VSSVNYCPPLEAKFSYFYSFIIDGMVYLVFELPAALSPFLSVTKQVLAQHNLFDCLLAVLGYLYIPIFEIRDHKVLDYGLGRKNADPMMLVFDPDYLYPIFEDIFFLDLDVL
jgi:hypothetical protein